MSDEHVVAPATLAVHEDRQAPRSTRWPCQSITTTRYKVIFIAQILFEGVIASVRIRYDKIGCPGARRLVLGLPYSAVMPMLHISLRSASLRGSLSKYPGLRLVLTIWAWRVIGRRWVGAVDHRFPLRMPALVSVPSRNSLSIARWPILPCSTLRSTVGSSSRGSPPNTCAALTSS